MMKRLLISLLVLALLCPAAMAESRVSFISGGSADRVHLRSAPSRTAESLGLYYTGTMVSSFHQNGDWTFVTIGAAEGWVMTGYLTEDAPAQLGPWCTVDNPHSTWVNLRAAPTMDGGVLACPDNGSYVHILGETADGWSYVEAAGVKGYMMTALLSPVEDAAAMKRTAIVGDTAEGDYIHRYAAPNGQALTFTAVEEEPPVTFRDVNFDGVTDIVVFVSMGASNFYTEFFVYDPSAGTYTRAAHRGIDYGLCNYRLYPVYGLVESRANNGSAGAEHEICLFRWKGTELELIRRAVSKPLTETSWSGPVYTTTKDVSRLSITVTDYEADDSESVAYGGVVTWERVVSAEDPAYLDVYDEEMEALWQGLR